MGYRFDTRDIDDPGFGLGGSNLEPRSNGNHVDVHEAHRNLALNASTPWTGWVSTRVYRLYTATAGDGEDQSNQTRENDMPP